MINPEYIEVEGKKYKINTDFRVAIKCGKIAENGDINDVERAMAIIYLLFGEKALDDTHNLEKLLELAEKYLRCGKDIIEEQTSEEMQDFDFGEDMPYIEASFMSDYHIDLEGKKMHWWKFMKLINGLSNSELGNCCVLNNVRNIRNLDVTKIKDEKERQKMIDAKQAVALKKNKKQYSQEEEDNIDEFNRLAGI